MSDRDWGNFLKFFLIIVAVAFILWLLGATIQFLTEQKFLFGIILGLVAGSVITFLIMRFLKR